VCHNNTIIVFSKVSATFVGNFARENNKERVIGSTYLSGGLVFLDYAPYYNRKGAHKKVEGACAFGKTLYMSLKKEQVVATAEF